jgi:hypothetical protein
MSIQATNYFYTLLAIGAIALMLANSFQNHADGIQEASERMALKCILDQVASKCTEMISLAETKGASTDIYLRMPNTIGNQRYWVGFSSDSSGSWVEGGFGEPFDGDTQCRRELPWNITASGTYRGGYGIMSINCSIQITELVITLSTLRVG